MTDDPGAKSHAPVEPALLAYATERVRFGSIGDLLRLELKHHLLSRALIEVAAAGLLTTERKVELTEQLRWRPELHASAQLVGELAAASLDAGGGTRITTSVHSDHPLPTRREVRLDKGGEMVTFTYA